ncbi:MAG TPA: hypothetical protein VM121_06645 [Acidimicrobiales bacterium]|nr:hypothetical protein [Acidimicrobiales bacterium]
MAYTCETCGKVMQSEGSFGLHNLTAHVAESVPMQGAVPAGTGGPWGPPPPPPPGAYGQYAGPYGPYGAPQKKSNTVAVVLGSIALVVVVLFVGSIAAITFLGGQAKPTPVTLVDPNAPPALPADFRYVVKSDDGFMIGLPAGFEETPLTAEGIANQADALDSANPGLAGVLRSNSSTVAAARLFAIDSATANNQMVQRIVMDGAGTVDDIPAGTFSDEYRDIGAESVIEEHVHLPAGDAVKVSAVISAGSESALITQHILVRDSTAWILTYTQDGGTDPAQATTVAFTFNYTK